MAGSKHEYGLSWIDQDALYNGIKTIFSKALGLARPSKELPPDPFTILAQAAIADTSFEDSLDFEHLRALNKTISNAVGEMHQHILGLAKNWENLGRSGGLLDVCTVPGYVHPKFGKPVVAEVKNRFNTIKASDEPKEWDKIKDATKIAKRLSTKGAQGYLFRFATAHEEDMVVFTLAQLGNHLFHQFQGISLLAMGREGRYGNPALSFLLLGDDGRFGPFATFIQACKIIRSFNTQFPEYPTVALVDRCNRLIGLVVDKRTTFSFLTVHSCHLGTTASHIGIDNPRTAEVVQVGHSINVIELIQLCREL